MPHIPPAIEGALDLQRSGAAAMLFAWIQLGFLVGSCLLTLLFLGLADRVRSSRSLFFTCASLFGLVLLFSIWLASRQFPLDPLLRRVVVVETVDLANGVELMFIQTPHLFEPIGYQEGILAVHDGKAFHLILTGLGVEKRWRLKDVEGDLLKPWRCHGTDATSGDSVVHAEKGNILL